MTKGQFQVKVEGIRGKEGGPAVTSKGDDVTLY